MTLFKKRRTYLDWASAAPVSQRARRAFEAGLRESGNPSSPHQEGVRAKTILEDSHTSIARMAGVKSSGVVFTGGATEANNLAIQGIVRKALRKKSNVHVLYAPGAHASIHDTVRKLESENVEVEELCIRDGDIDMEALKSQVRPTTTLIALEAVCGETGVHFNTREVARVIQKAGSSAHIHVDASQLPYIDSFELSKLGAQSVTLDAQKVGGVRGIGALLLRDTHALEPLMYGGGQEGGLRPGTESPALAAAFCAALTEANDEREKFVKRAVKMRVQLVEGVTKNIRDAIVLQVEDQAPHIVNFSFIGRDTDYAVMLLDAAGFAVSTKSACETDADGSRAVLALTGDTAQATSTLRVSFGPTTAASELRRFQSALITTISFLDANSLY